MYNKIRFFIKNDLEQHKKKEPVLKNSFSTYLVWAVSLVIFLIPAIFLNEKLIVNNEILRMLSDSISIIFPAIETKALISESVNLYYYFKFINVLVILTILIVFIIYSIPIFKVYLCSLRFIKCKNKIYINKNIEEDKYIFSMVLYSIGLIYIIGLIYFSFFFEANFDLDSKFNSIFKSKIFIIFYNYIMSYFIGLLLAFLTADTFGRCYKFYLKLRS